MERIALRKIFSNLESPERLGVFVRCPLVRGVSDLDDCVGCVHYRGLQTADRQAFELRCNLADPPEPMTRALCRVPQLALG